MKVKKSACWRHRFLPPAAAKSKSPKVGQSGCKWLLHAPSASLRHLQPLKAENKSSDIRSRRVNIASPPPPSVGPWGPGGSSPPAELSTNRMNEACQLQRSYSALQQLQCRRWGSGLIFPALLEGMWGGGSCFDCRWDSHLHASCLLCETLYGAPPAHTPLRMFARHTHTARTRHTHAHTRAGPMAFERCLGRVRVPCPDDVIT